MTAAHKTIHDWFGLTYSSYLVLHRSLLQSMPDEWQERFVAMLEEFDEAFGDERGLVSSFHVRASVDGKFAHDPLADYSRGRRRIPMRAKRSL